MKVRISAFCTDFPPVFTANTYYGSVLERHESAEVVAQVKAIDKDLENNTITYSILSGNDDGFFNIDSNSGEIRIVNGKGVQLDFDVRKQFSLLVQAKDSHLTPLSGLTIVVIDVKDTSMFIPSPPWCFRLTRLYFTLLSFR